MIRVRYDLKAVKRKLLEVQEKIVQQKREEAIEKLKASTPVDTGEARDGWHLENGAAVNSVEHIANLNSGSSRQAPAYFIEKTLLLNGFKPNGTIVSYK